MTCARSCLLLFALFLSSCIPDGDSGARTLQEVRDTRKQIGDSVDALEKKLTVLETAQKSAESLQGRLLQSAGDHVGAAAAVIAKTPDAPTQRLYVRAATSHLAVAASALPPPTEAMKRDIEQTLREIITGNEQAIAELQATNERIAAENVRLSTALGQALADRDAAKGEVAGARGVLAEKTGELAQKEAVLKEEVARRSDAQLQAARERGSKARLAIAYLFIALGGILIVGAIVATMLHVPGVLAAGLPSGGTLIVLGIGITVIDEWLSYSWVHWALAAFLLVVISALAAWCWRRISATGAKAALDAGIATGAIGAIQEFKDAALEHGTGEYEGLRTRLNEWYTDDDGRPDTVIDKEIDRRLVEMNLVDVKR